MNVLKFSNGVFAVEVFGETPEHAEQRMRELLRGEYGHYAGEISHDDIPTADRLAEAEEVIKHYGDAHNWDKSGGIEAKYYLPALYGYDKAKSYLKKHGIE